MHWPYLAPPECLDQKDRDDAVRCCPGEAATLGAAVSMLAERMGPTLRGAASKQDREALARMMVKFGPGRVEVGPHVVYWWLADDDTKDLMYLIR